MRRFADQELASACLFFGAGAWLLVDALLSVPRKPPGLWPLVPMLIAVAWYVGIEHRRSRSRA